MCGNYVFNNMCINITVLYPKNCIFHENNTTNQADGLFVKIANFLCTCKCMLLSEITLTFVNFSLQTSVTLCVFIVLIIGCEYLCKSMLIFCG